MEVTNGSDRREDYFRSNNPLVIVLSGRCEEIDNSKGLFLKLQRR